MQVSLMGYFLFLPHHCSNVLASFSQGSQGCDSLAGQPLFELKLKLISENVQELACFVLVGKSEH